MRTLLICHQGADLDREGLARWLGSFSDFAGAVVIREAARRKRQRVLREIRRVGAWRFVDVLAFRAFYALTQAAADRRWEASALERLRTAFPVRRDAPEIVVTSPNGAEAEAFIRSRRPDLVIARCKTLLAERVFSIPRHGTFVLHPGICPEYRNAHGCFWALANRDLGKVGMTLLQVDDHVDTGPVYGYYSYRFDEVNDTPTMIHQRVVLDNLDELRAKLLDICAERATPIDTSGRPSAAWGQPWLTKYLAWKRAARRAA